MWEDLRGLPPSKTIGFKGQYPGMVRLAHGDIIRDSHESELFPVLTGVLCMDGGEFMVKYDEGFMAMSDYQSEWKKSEDRWRDFGTVG